MRKRRNYIRHKITFEFCYRLWFQGTHTISEIIPEYSEYQKYIIVYENISDKFDNGHSFGSRSRSQMDFEIFLHLPQYKLSGPITQLWCKLESLYIQYVGSSDKNTKYF